jgi:hypothetical protein
MLRDILKPSNLIIALVASVLLILMGWYMFILKPAFNESNPIDMHLTEPNKQPSSFEEMTVNSGSEKVITTAPSGDSVSKKPSAKEPQAAVVKKKVANSERRDVQPKHEASSENNTPNNEVSDTQKSGSNTVEALKALFPPVAKPSCTQAQIAMHQCQQN